jgi:putative membrane protein
MKADFDKLSLKKKDSELEPALHKTFLYSDPSAHNPETLSSSKEFLVSMSGVNTSNAIFGLVAFAAIGRTRSGAMVAVKEILGTDSLDLPILLLFFAAMVLTALFSYFSTVWIGNNAHHFLKKLDYTKLCAGVLVGLTVIVVLFTGFFGLFIFVVSTPIGMLASFMNVRKSHAMGVILLPVILYFL